MFMGVYYILKYSAADSVFLLEIFKNCPINIPLQCFRRLSDEKSHKNPILKENENSNLMFCILISHSCLTSRVSAIPLQLMGLTQYPKVKVATRFGCPGAQCIML